ncbi:hypothetical protein [Celeribacter persicus]|uniref:Uncharacterized protein n=1 Tax=Celeribacter persicus TaxID=1651082 RepID=A0A2T5HAJ3_9RHOB|nr:hypothetical protein [Celeribacter persicus]PTQ68600.1 hypothetical protein C8N42_11476 [Celeribacter persicus]
MSTKNDPAYKYVPKSKAKPTQGEGGEDMASAGMVKHGLFTDIAYVTAWAVGLLGSLAGLMILLPALEGGYNASYNLMSGIGIFAGSWVSASGLGVLAEISRKLSMRAS